MAFHSAPYHSASKQQPSGSHRQEERVEKPAHTMFFPQPVPAAFYYRHSWGLSKVQTRSTGAAAAFLVTAWICLAKFPGALEAAPGAKLIEILLVKYLALINAPFKCILEQEGGKLTWSVRVIMAKELPRSRRGEKWKMKAGKWLKQTVTLGQWKGVTEGKWHSKNKCCRRKKSF